MLSVPGDPRVLGMMARPRHFDSPAGVVAITDRLDDATSAGFARSSRSAAAPGAGLTTTSTHDRGYRHQLAALLGWTSLPFLPALRQRVLLVAGDHDPIVPSANADLMNVLIRRSTVLRFSGGHAGIITAASEIGPAVSDFLNEPGMD
jgi:pimeloyl-ACP methyl ester carboxylesterase